MSLLSFEAFLSGNNNIQVVWKTSAEYKSRFFTLEKSADGRQFKEAAIISSTGNGVANLTYAWEDMNPYEGANYYRLSQTDTDGIKTFFDIIKVNAGNTVESIRAFPTFMHNEPLKIVVSNRTNKIDVRIADLSGRLIYKNSVINQTELLIPSSYLSLGLNIVEIRTDSISKKVKVLKNN